MRRHARFQALPVALAAVLLLASCADKEEDPGMSTPPSSEQAGSIVLDIVVRADGQTQSAAYSLQCSGVSALASSLHPRADEACSLVSENPQILDPTPSPGTQMCTEQYGGPATASVTGTVDGKAVSRDFDLKNGCGISAWNDALPLLVEQPTGN